MPQGLVPGAFSGAPAWGAVGAGIEPPGVVSVPSAVSITHGMTMAEIEKAAILAALRETRGNRRKAAEVLDIGERTLYRKLKEYQVPDRFGE
jgi:DNA-binding NtrC family response regulator